MLIGVFFRTNGVFLHTIGIKNKINGLMFEFLIFIFYFYFDKIINAIHIVNTISTPKLYSHGII
jgi:hypothetical protein